MNIVFVCWEAHIDKTGFSGDESLIRAEPVILNRAETLHVPSVGPGLKRLDAVFVFNYHAPGMVLRNNA